MPGYTDVLGKPLPKGEIAAAARWASQSKQITALEMSRQFGWGYGKAYRVMQLLEQSGVVSTVDLSGTKSRTILLRRQDAAINAALRQLKKGRR